MKNKKVTKQSRLTLAELSALAGLVQRLLIESEGEVTLKIEELEEQFKDQFENKIQCIAHIIKQEQSKVEFDKQLIKDVQQRIKSRQSKIESLEKYLLYGLQLSGVDAVEGVHAVKVYKKADSLKVINENTIPDYYINAKLEIKGAFYRVETISELLISNGIESEVSRTCSVDKKAVLQALKDGLSVAGAVLIENQKRLSIK